MKNNFVRELIKHSLLSYKRKNSSLVVAFLGLSVGVCSLIVIAGTMNGMQGLIIDELVHIEAYNYQGTSNIARLSQVESRLESDPSIRLVVPFVDEFVFLKSEYGSRVVNLRAAERQKLIVDDDFIEAVSLSTERNKLQLLKSPDSRIPILMGWSLSGALGVKEGDSIQVTLPSAGKGFLPYEFEGVVSNIFYSGGKYDLQWVFMSLGDYLDINKAIDQVQLGIRTHDNKKIKQVLSQELSDVESWQEKNNSLYIALRSEKLVLLLLSAVVFGILVLHFRFALIRRIKIKRDDIVSLRTMGASPQHIVRWFLGETICISVLGAVFGVMLGLTILYQFDNIQSFFIQLFGGVPSIGYSIHGRISVGELVLIVLFMWGSVLTTTRSIVRRVNEISPLQVLRFE